MTGSEKKSADDRIKEMQAAGTASTKQAETKPAGLPSAGEQAKSLQKQGVTPTTGTSASGQAAAGDTKSQDTAGSGGTGAEEVHDNLMNPSGPIGLQKEPALFTPTGSVELNMLPSPTGPIPASLITDEGQRKAALDATIKSIKSGGRVRNSRENDEPLGGLCTGQGRVTIGFGATVVTDCLLRLRTAG